MRRLQMLAAATLAIVMLACGENIAGPKPPSATNAFIKATTTLSKVLLGRGDTMRFHFSIENITSDSLTMTTNGGCQIKPELDQVGGQRMIPRALSNALQCPNTPTVRKMAAGEILSFSILLRGYDPNTDRDLQTPGYLLSSGVFDASVYVFANEIGGLVRSDWVRFEVR